MMNEDEEEMTSGNDEGNHDNQEDPTTAGGTTDPNTAKWGTVPWGTVTVIGSGSSGGGAGGGGILSSLYYSGGSLFSYPSSSWWGSPPERKKFSGKPVESTAPVYGWRGYTMDSETATLHGATKEWPEREFQAECNNYRDYPSPQEQWAEQALKEFPDLLEQYKARKQGVPASRREVCLQHLESDSCTGSSYGCGIWGRAKPDAVDTEDYQIVAHCIAWGTVLLDEDENWRASDVRIEALYVVKEAFQDEDYFKYIDFDRMAADLYARYVVPVRVIDSLEELSGD